MSPVSLLQVFRTSRARRPSTACPTAPGLLDTFVQRPPVAIARGLPRERGRGRRTSSVLAVVVRGWRLSLHGFSGPKAHETVILLLYHGHFIDGNKFHPPLPRL